jgi:hypothetical protein
MTLQSNVCACWRTYQLIWDLDKRMNWKKKILYLHVLYHLTQGEELIF